MPTAKILDEAELRYLKMLARQYPTVQAASTEIINLQAILNLPKGTEHFISDVHGEHEAFLHILNSCSGVIREQMDQLFGTSVPRAELDTLATLIYYPEEKLEQLRGETGDMDEWYRITLHRLVALCRLVSSKYTRSKVRKALPRDYAYIIEELLHTHNDELDKRDYFENIIAAIIGTGQAPGFIAAVCTLIKRMAVDHMHLVGDIFDRGPRADVIMDSLVNHHSVDVQWGNHEVCRRYGVPFYDLKSDKTRGVSTPLRPMDVCCRALDADLLINLPVLKGHCQTVMTCALKNLKGCIPDREKRRFHSEGFIKPIAALAAALKPGLVIVDSICGDLNFEEGGNPVHTNRMYLGTDPVQLDAYGCKLMGLSLDEVPYIGLAERWGAGFTSLGSATTGRSPSARAGRANHFPASGSGTAAPARRGASKAARPRRRPWRGHFRRTPHEF